MTNRTLIRLAVVSLLGFTVLTSGPADAAEDFARDARLHTVAGEFGQADAVLERAPEELQNDHRLRTQLAGIALKYIKRRDGKERRAGLLAARNHFAKAVDIKPDDMKSAIGALEAGSELAVLDLEAKRPDDAYAKGVWAVEFGKKVLGGEFATPEFKLALADAHAARASVAHKVKHLEEIIADYGRAADLKIEAAEGHAKSGDILGAATRMLQRQAQFIHDSIPLETETRDEEAMRRAIDLANKGCQMENAGKEAFTAHLLLLRAAHKMEMKEDFGLPYMKELLPKITGLDLKVPKSKGWKNTQSEQWDFSIDRRFEEEDHTVQIMIKAWPHTETLYGKYFREVEYIAQKRSENRQDLFDDPKVLVDFVELPYDAKAAASKKKKRKKKRKKKGDKRPTVYHFQIAGKLEKGGRQQRLAEWWWLGPDKSGITYQLKILDWDLPFETTEPDIVAFLHSAFGFAPWPEGPEPPPPEDPKKKGKR